MGGSGAEREAPRLLATAWPIVAPSALSQRCLQSETFNPSQNFLYHKIPSRSNVRHGRGYQKSTLGKWRAHGTQGHEQGLGGKGPGKSPIIGGEAPVQNHISPQAVLIQLWSTSLDSLNLFSVLETQQD